MASPLAAHAATVTAADLDGKFYGAYQRGTVYEKTFPKEQFSGYFEMRGSQLYMCDFWRGFDLPVEVSDNQLILSTSTVYGEADLRFPGLPMRIFRNRRYNYTGSGYYDYGYTSSSLGSLVMTLSDDAPVKGCRYYFSCLQINRVRITLPSGALAESQGDGFEVFVFDTNSQATDYTAGRVTDRFNVDLQFSNADQTVGTIKNWAAWGVNFISTTSSTGNTCKVKWTDVTFDYDNETVTVPRQILGSEVVGKTTYIGSGKLHGYYADWDRYYGGLPSIYHMYAASGKSGTGGDIVGKIRPWNPRHVKGTETLWEQESGGELATHLNMDLVFPANQTYGGMGSETMGWVDSTVIRTPYTYPYTHTVKLEVSRMGCDSENGLFVEAKVSGSKRDRYVSGYELFAVPGKYSSITDEGFVTDLESGHVTACRLDTHFEMPDDAAVMADRAAKPSETSFSRLLTPAEMPASWNRNNTDYTFFLKASYHENTGLAPTYHALTTARINTGVEDLTVDADCATVKVDGGCIVVEGSTDPVRVFTATGTSVYAGADRRIAVAPGAYIVTVGRTVSKVMVR